jgi:D-sedoheptulose 7-phosphate isomerase
MSHTPLDEKRLALVRTHVDTGNQVRALVAQQCSGTILRAADCLATCFRQSRKVLLCGNGGSAADCQHIAAELMSRLTRDVERPGLPAIALTTDTSFLTAFANDCGFEGVFARQVQALGQADDVLIAISTSGESPNVLRAVSAANDLGLHTIGLVGDAGRLTSMVDIPIVIPSRNTQYIQEAMLAVEHILCDLTERALFDPEFRRHAAGQ